MQELLIQHFDPCCHLQIFQGEDGEYSQKSILPQTSSLPAVHREIPFLQKVGRRPPITIA